MRNAVQSSIIETCEDNYANIYNGVREGYSGGYRAEKSGIWTESLDAGDIYGRIDKRLKSHDEGGEHIKYSNGAEEYTISGLQAEITNTPFAPSKQNAKQMTCFAEIDLKVPLSFGWQSLPPMRTHLSIKGGYTPKF